MKKYVWLLSSTFIMVLLINLLGYYLKTSIVDVEIQHIVSENVEDTIICLGKIEYIEAEEIYSEFSATTDKINVNVGDVVNKGDTLMSVSETKMSGTDYGELMVDNKISDNNSENIQQFYKSLLEDDNAKEVLSKSKNNGTDYIKTGPQVDIKSPIGGLVSSINTSERDVYGKEKKLMVISDSNKFQVHLLVNESKISDISVGQKVIVTGTGFKGLEYLGEISKISSEAQQIVNTTGKETVVDVYVSVNESPDTIKSGLTAKCQIITSEKPGATIVPYKSVQTDDDGREFVYKLVNGRAIKTYIETSGEYKEGFEVINGVEEGTYIITNPDAVYNHCKVRTSKKETEY